MGSEDLRADIAAARDRMETRIGANREIRKLAEHLWEGETVEYMSSGYYGAGVGLVALTDRRLLFIKDGRMSKTTEDFPLEKISSVQWSSGVLQGVLTVFASGNKAEIKQMGKKDGKQIADIIRGRLSSGPAVAGPSPAPPASATVTQTPVASGEDVFEALEKLGRLRDAGVVTDTEFETKKAELLARI